MPRSTIRSFNGKPRTVRQLRAAILRLPPDPPREYPGKLFKTQKEHWLSWLKYYNTQGAYGRRSGMNHDARYAYNHIVEPKMLLWLIPAAGMKPALVRAAHAAAKVPRTMMAQAAAVRRVVPWETVEAALWPGKSARPPKWLDDGVVCREIG